MLYAFEEGAYYSPHEMIVMGANNHKSFSSFQAKMNILSNVLVVLLSLV